MKTYLEKSYKIKTKNPNEKIEKITDEVFMHNLFDWDVFQNEGYPISKPYEDLNPGKWLVDETIFIAIKSFIKYYDMNEFVSIFHSDIISMIIEKKYKNIFNYSKANSMLNKQMIFINLYGDSFGFKVRAHFILAIINFKGKQIIIMDSLSNERIRKDYLCAFKLILDLLFLVYCSFEKLDLFKFDEWRFIISKDSGEQNDSSSCGSFFLFRNIEKICS